MTKPAMENALEWDTVKEFRVVLPQRVVYRKLAMETVLLNVQTGLYYGMDQVGGRFFEVLCDARSVASAVDSLAQEFDAPIEQIRIDMLRYCNELLTHGLIELETRVEKHSAAH